MNKFITLLAISFLCFDLTYSQAGQLDSTFSYGIVPTRFAGTEAYNGPVKKILLLPDSSMYVLYTSPNLLAKRHANGTLDVTYGRGGFSPVNIDIADAALQADGKVVVAGSRRYEEDYSTGIALIRYNTNGTIDAGFARNWRNSYTPPDLYGGQFSSSVTIGSDGRIVVASSLTYYEEKSFLLYWYNSDGTFSNAANDPEFTGGYATATQSDGKILVAAEESNENNTSFFIARYKTDGTRDSSFSKDGKLPINFAPGFNGLTLQTDGKVVVCSSLKNNLLLARYNTNGTPDVGFALDGEQSVKFGSVCSGNSVVVQLDGKIVVAGRVNSGSKSDFFTARFKPDGSLDNSFSEDGKQMTDFGPFEEASVVGVQGNGKIIAGGSGANLVRYNTDGSLDNTFSKDGKLSLELSSHRDKATSLAVQDDGKVVVVGNGLKNDTISISFLSRFNSNGIPDSTFGVNGQQQIDFGNAVAIQKDGKILVAGSMKTGKGLDFALARYNSDATPDVTFSEDGKLTTDFEGGDDEATFLDVQNDGKIVAGGFSDRNPKKFVALARYNTNGTLDATFSRNGKINSAFLYSGAAKFIALQKDRKIVVTGSLGEGSFSIERYNTNGTLDTTFFQDGIQSTKFDNNDWIAQSVAIQSDGKIVVEVSRKFSPTWCLLLTLLPTL